MLPHQGGRVRFVDGEDRYANGKSPWRCSWCGCVSPWVEGWGGYWSLLEADGGLYADARPGGWPVWCSPECGAKVQASGATTAFVVPSVTRKPKPRKPSR